MDLAQKHRDRLKILKTSVETSWQHFRKNSERYMDFMKFVFDTSLTNEDVTKLQTLSKPTIEFNVLEAMVSRLRGEFAKQEPGIMVRASDGVPTQKLTPDFIQMLDVIESYLREIITDSSTDGLQYNIYTDLLGGGYSVVEMFTDYINNMSFDQQIIAKRVYDPTMTGFDPLARESHKGDGNYCFQLFPKSKEEFQEEFGEEATKEMKFSRGLGPFNWSYAYEDRDVLLVCDYYEKKKKKIKVVKLSTGHVVNKVHFKELLEEWDKKGFIEAPPVILEERYSEIEHIVRYRFCETRVLAYDETDYRFLPLIFIDGNSVDIRDQDSGATMQMTRPYAYHAKGIQRLKNFSGQTVASEIENMVQHKFKVAIESIPPDYQEAYRNVQQASVLMYNAFYKDNPEVALPPPAEIQRTPTPPIVESTFLGSDRVTQAILGSYDGVLGTNDKDISGIAITQGAIQTNAASTPYLMGYIKGLNRICQIAIDLIPKYYVTPRSLPIRTPDGKRSYQIINDQKNPNSIEINYRPHELQVKVEAGVNTAIQKHVALDQIIRMTQASPLFAQFINTEGLETLLDNMDIRGIEGLKAKAMQFMEMLRKQSEQPPPPDPMAEVAKGALEIEAMKVEQRREESEGQQAINAAKVAIEKQKVDAQVMQIINDIETKNAKLGIEQEKLDSENARTAVETAINLSKHHHERNLAQTEGESNESR
jgi:hypothetical protein